MKIVISVSRGTDDPTQATLPLIAAKAARAQGHDVTVWLQNEAVTLARQGIADSVVGVGIPPLREVLAALVEANTPIWVCQACAVARKISPEILVKGGILKGMDAFVGLVVESDKNIEF
jgi:uncharacterized protein involved in oxidation of intracellular sulfur